MDSAASVSKNCLQFSAKYFYADFLRIFSVIILRTKGILRLLKLISLFRAAAVTDSSVWASIQIDMRLQIEKRIRLQHTARLNRLVFGVALLWLVTSVLLLVISGLGSARSDHNDRQHDRTRKDVHHQLFARGENQATARASFLS